MSRAAAVEISTRDALVAAAASVFTRFGFRGASLREIAAEAGMTTGAIYSNFDGKTDLFLTVLEERIDPSIATMYEAAREAPPRAVGRRVGKKFTSYVKQQRRWLVLLIEFWAEAARDPELSPKFGERHARLRAEIAGVLEQRSAKFGRQVDLPADQLAMVLIAFTNGMAVEQLADPEAVPASL